jgi:trehalose 6-phosphate phosphatase
MNAADGAPPPALALAPTDALFLDFDGTLAELGPDPDAIRLSAETTALLAALGPALGGAVVVISGRDLRDLAGRVPPQVWRAGGHGLEIVAPGEALPDAPAEAPEAVLGPLRRAAETPGVRLEVKGPVVALHYRAAPDARDACHAAAEDARAPGHVVQRGKCVVEVKPEAANKGRALRRLMTRAEFAGRRAVMVGDDATDEDAIAAALALGGTGVKVGEGESRAPWRVESPEALRRWLEGELRRLRG